ncbi:hypothetical protein SLA2020_067980 [Shorea laevis]
MAPPNHRLVSAAIFLALLIVSPAPAMARAAKHSRLLPPPSSKLVEQVCNGSAITNRRFCLKALSNPEAAAATSLNGLTKVILHLAATNAQHTLDIINGMITSGKTTSPAIKSCAGNYQEVIRSFRMVVGELTEDPMTANYDVKVVGDFIDYCEKALASGNVHVPRISVGNRFVMNYVWMGFQATNNM